MQPISVSVIIPVKNRRRFLRAAVESVLAEGLEGVEVLIIDDGSDDGSLDVVADLPVSTHRFSESHGVAAAINAGLLLARGEYVTGLGSDDLLVRDGLRWRVAWLAAHPADDAVAGVLQEAIDEDDLPIGSLESVLGLNGMSLPPRLTLDFVRDNPRYLCSLTALLVRTKRMRGIGTLDVSLKAAAEKDYFLRLLRQASIRLVLRPVFRYRLHDQNMSVRRTETGFCLV